jgi:hypothetical protein
MILQGNTLVKFEQVAVDIVQTLSHHQQHILPNY